jgi:hypothetical protein
MASGIDTVGLHPYNLHIQKQSYYLAYCKVQDVLLYSRHKRSNLALQVRT